jgi:hypothetical protein
MEGIVGAAGRLMIQTWALSPYGVLAGKLMFGNKPDRRKLSATRSYTIALAVGLSGQPQQLSYLAFFRWHRWWIGLGRTGFELLRSSYQNQLEQHRGSQCTEQRLCVPKT